MRKLAVGVLVFGAVLSSAPSLLSQWSVVDGAIHGVTDKTSGELILTDGDYADFRLILKSRLVSEANHLGMCFWGDRRPDWRYGECILVIPKTSKSNSIPRSIV